MRIGRVRLALLLLAALVPDAGAESWCNTPAIIGHGAMEVEGVEEDGELLDLGGAPGN